MTLLFAKLVLTPCVMWLATLASRRWGHAVAGWLVGLPLISGPTAIFLTLERGPDFAARASVGSVAGVASQACFCMGYAAFARAGVAPAALAAGASYVAAASLANALAPPLGLIAPAALALLALARRTLPPAPPGLAPVAPPRWDLPARLIVVTLVVMGVTTLAGALGPLVSGMSASFPWIGGTLAVFAQVHGGPAAGVAALRGMASALFGFLAFFVVTAAALPLYPALVVFGAATLTALALQAFSLGWIRRDARRVAAESLSA